MAEDGGEAGREDALRHEQLVRPAAGEAGREEPGELGRAGRVGPRVLAQAARPEQAGDVQGVDNNNLQPVIPQVVRGHVQTAGRTGADPGGEESLDELH